MREIKFRAWDKDRKKMVYGAPEVNPKDCGNLIYCDMETIAIGLEGDLYLVDECGNYEYPANWDNDYNYELMQYTGLKDKNGKELYEGDIVFAGSNYKSVVLWDDNTASFRIKTVKPQYTAYEDLAVELHNYEVEVIGNIYENPELLD